MEMTLDEIYKYCESNRESDGFCRLCTGCSGPAPSHLACDRNAGKQVLRGGRYGSCCFEVKKSAQD